MTCRRRICIDYSLCTNRCINQLHLRFLSVGGDISLARDPMTESTNCYNPATCIRIFCTFNRLLVFPWYPDLQLRNLPTVIAIGFVSSASPQAVPALVLPCVVLSHLGRSALESGLCCFRIPWSYLNDTCTPFFIQCNEKTK